ncbi:MAG TPA: hypothetical protein PKL96_12705 [Bacteroidales bacterium]|nr:hypothetical protein [Bacteroidales bacterium]
MKQEFLNLMFGNATWITYVAGFVFVFFGLVIKWYIEISRAIKGNDNTPDRWDWRYFLQNNLFKKLFSIFANIIIAFVALRFSTEIFNIPLSMAFSLAIGIGFDEVVNRISKWQKKLK